jgi:hypothetical protein
MYGRNNSSNKILKKKSIQRTTIKSNSIDEGVIAFGHWLESEDKQSPLLNTIVLKEFNRKNFAILQDNSDSFNPKKITVSLIDGIPLCQDCSSDDCAHVGFTICLKQMDSRSGIMGI